jgi:hypothetical protein
MANEEGLGGPEDLSQDPFVDRLRPDPAEPPTPVIVLEGLSGESSREGYWRLYFTRELDNYAEFRAEDVVYSERIPRDQPPFMGLDATRVGIRRDATIEYTQARTSRPVDEFDLDIRLGTSRGTRRAHVRNIPETFLPVQCQDTGGFCPTEVGLSCVGTCGDDTCQITVCRGHTCMDAGTCDTCPRTCNTCPGQTCDTCQTCPTQCAEVTCAATCHTCPTQCGHTCNTCQTQCDTCAGQTCHPRTCDTCNPHACHF